MQFDNPPLELIGHTVTVNALSTSVCSMNTANITLDFISDILTEIKTNLIERPMTHNNSWAAGQKASSHWVFCFIF